MNMRRLTFQDNIRISSAFFRENAGQSPGHSWVLRWTSELIVAMQSTNIGQSPTHARLAMAGGNHDMSNAVGPPSTYSERFRTAIVALEEILKDTTSMTEALIAANELGNTPARSRPMVSKHAVWLKTLDFGASFLDALEEMQEYSVPDPEEYGIHDLSNHCLSTIAQAGNGSLEKGSGNGQYGNNISSEPSHSSDSMSRVEPVGNGFDSAPRTKNAFLEPVEMISGIEMGTYLIRGVVIRLTLNKGGRRPTPKLVSSLKDLQGSPQWKRVTL